MGKLNVTQFATELGLPVPLLLEQLNAAGIAKEQDSDPVSEKDELDRLSGILKNVLNFKQTLSIDTYKPNVAKIALENGFNMINDIMGGESL
jgi:dihydropteroate synthase